MFTGREAYDKFLNISAAERYYLEQLWKSGSTTTTTCVPTTTISAFEKSSGLHNLQFKEFDPFDKQTWPSIGEKRYVFAICWVESGTEIPSSVEIVGEGIQHAGADVVLFNPMGWMGKDLPFKGEDAELVEKFPFWLQLSQSLRMYGPDEEPKEQNDHGPCYSLDARSFNKSGSWAKFKIAFLTKIDDIDKK